MSYASGYEKAFPYFVSASDFAEAVILGEKKYEDLLVHIVETKKILPGLKIESYKDWVDKEISRYNRIKLAGKVTH